MWDKFLRPTKRKVTLAFLLTLGWYLLEQIIVRVNQSRESITIFLPNTTELNYSLLIPFIMLAILLYTLYNYPLACYISHLIDVRKSGKIIPSRKKAKLLLFVIIFNPFTLRLLLALIYMLFVVIFK